MRFLSPALMLLSFSAGALANEAEIETKTSARIFNTLSFLYACKQEDYQLQCINGEDSCTEVGLTGCHRKIIYTKVGKSFIVTANTSNAPIAIAQNEAINSSQHAASKVAHEAALAAQQAAVQAAAQQAAAQQAAAQQAAAQAALAAANAAMAAQNAAMASAPPPM